MALVPLGSELERIMGSVRLFYMIVLLATSNAIFHVLIASLVAYNPFYSYHYLMNECAIGFSGILFSMIVIETSLSGAQTRRLVFSISIIKYLFGIPSGSYAETFNSWELKFPWIGILIGQSIWNFEIALNSYLPLLVKFIFSASASASFWSNLII